MIRLRVNLNSSAGGVLYHYCRDFDDVVSIVDNGMCPANNFQEVPHAHGLDGKPQPFISFSRTRDNPARIGYIYRGEGGGIVYSKDALSNLGTFEAFHHGGDNHEGNEIRVLIPTPSVVWFDPSKPQVIKFVFEHKIFRIRGEETHRYTVLASIPLVTGTPTWKYTDIEDPKEVEELQQWIERNKANLLDFGTRKGYENSLVCEFGIEMTVDKDTNKLPKGLQAAIQNSMNAIEAYKEDNPGEEGYFYIKAPFLNSMKDKSTWVKMQNSPQFSYEDLLDIIKKTDELEEAGDPIASVAYQDSTHQQIQAIIPTSLFGKSYRDLPPTLQTILSYQKWNETEDRLWVNPRFVQGTPGNYKPIPETCKAVIGIIVPDNTYFNPEVEQFRKDHPNLPVYAYTDSHKKKAAGVPPEAYKSPVA